MAKRKTRILRDIPGFADYIVKTDNRQLDIDPVTTNPRFQNWGWTPAESTAWTGFRTATDPLWAIYDSDTLRNKDAKEQINLIIKQAVAYDKEHKLLDKIGITPVPPATLLDFEIFRVIRGTPLADIVPTISDEDLGKPLVSIHKIDHLKHVLKITPEIDGSHGVVNRIKDMEVYRAIVAPDAPEPTPDKYEYMGDAKRRRFTSEFADGDFRKDVWYKARIEGTNGKKYTFSKPFRETIV
jgi:hypothetical protein